MVMVMWSMMVVEMVVFGSEALYSGITTQSIEMFDLLYLALEEGMV